MNWYKINPALNIPQFDSRILAKCGYRIGFIFVKRLKSSLTYFIKVSGKDKNRFPKGIVIFDVNKKANNLLPVSQKKDIRTSIVNLQVNEIFF